MVLRARARENSPAHGPPILGGVTFILVLAMAEGDDSTALLHAGHGEHTDTTAGV